LTRLVFGDVGFQEWARAGHQWLTPVILALRRQRSEDCGSKPVWANSSQDPISKPKQQQKTKKTNPPQKRASRVAQGVSPMFKPQNQGEKKKNGLDLGLIITKTKFVTGTTFSCLFFL
jgi:hypothetical protein